MSTKSKKKANKKGYTLAPSPNLSPGATVRILREMLELSQNDLAKKTGINQATISGIEMDRISLGVERAKIFAVALHVHPSVILFGNWEEEKKEYMERVA